MWFCVLFSVFLEVAIEINSKFKSKFMLIFHHLTFFLIEVCPIDVYEQIFRLISDKCRLLIESTINLDLEVELFV